MLTGNIPMSFLGASGVIVCMFFIGLSIDIIIETIKNLKGTGTIIGFITNGPEMICLAVGLWVGDVLFAASTPLGSNVINPLLLVVAALTAGRFLVVYKIKLLYSSTAVVLMATTAISFFFIKETAYPIWITVAIIVSLSFFIFRPKEHESAFEHVRITKFWIGPAILTLLLMGYFLDPVVSFASENSNAPKGVIGFFILALLTSWPEFKSTLGLISRGRYLSSIINIVVSNITNLWLASAGILFYLFWPAAQ